MGKSSTWIYVGSVGLIIAAIALTAVLDRSKSGQEDIRAKAGIVTGLDATATVSSVNESVGALLVTSFVIEEGKSNNTAQIWTLRLPSDANTTVLGPGVRVKLTVDPKTVKIDSRTATILSVTPHR